MSDSPKTITNSDELHALNEMRETIENVTSARQGFLDKFMDPRRSINDECGFPGTQEIDIHKHYKELYQREGVATRVVEIMPDECWAISPELKEDSNLDEDTPFEAAFKDMSRKLRGKSWYVGEEGSPFWELLRRADILSGIGFYGVIFLGINDGLDPQEPAEPKENAELLYARTFDQSLIEITSTEQDKQNPRYGQPLEYSLTLNDPSAIQVTTSSTTNTLKVHWTRVIHIADNLGSNDLYGDPRQRPVLNNLLSLRKLYAGSAEMYWRGAFPGLSFESHPSLGGDVKFDKVAMKAAAEQYMNTLQRYIQTTGFNVKSLAPQVVSPEKQIDVQLDVICIKITVPKRIFVGSERGELASSQDTKSWNGRVANRQSTYVTPRIIVPVIDRLILLGVLPEPEQGYSIEWKDRNTLSEIEEADLAVKRTEAMAKYVQAEVSDGLMAHKDYLVRVIGFDEETADAILEATIDSIRELERDDEEGNVEAEEG